MAVEENRDSFETFFAAVNEVCCSDSFVNVFRDLNSDEERVGYLYSLEVVKEYNVEADLHWTRKSQEESVKLRNEGNTFFQKKKNVAALSRYNKSVACAPLDGDKRELGLALANRSAVFFHLKKYKECVADIESAFECGYPNELAYKLHDRQGKCLLRLGQVDNAKVSFEKATTLLGSSKLDDKKRASWLSDLGCQMKNCQITDNKKVNCEIKSVKAYKLPSLKCQNPKFPSLSADVGVNQSEERGRFPYAERDIKIGEIVAIDKPYASVAVPAEIFSHCHECYTFVHAAVPCQHCSFVVYCSEQCRQSSWDRHHSVECSLLPAVYSSDIGLGRLALRTAIVTGMSGMKQVHSNSTTDTDGIVGCDKDGVFGTSYDSIYHLVNHSDKRAVGDLVRMTAVAVYLTKLLCKVNLLDESESDFILVASHILRNIQMMPCNAHEVSELELDKRSVATSKKIEIGSAIYATCSLFNHSCDPNVVRHSYKDVCVVRTIRQIHKGEELVDNYGYLSAMTPLQRRLFRLNKQYFFTCSCTACANDWPQYLEMEDSLPVFKCVKCSGAVCIRSDSYDNLYLCVDCNLPQDISSKFDVWNQSHIKYSRVMEALKSSSSELDVKPWIKILTSHLRLLDDLACRPCKEYNECQEALKQCWSIKANCHVVN